MRQVEPLAAGVAEEDPSTIRIRLWMWVVLWGCLIAVSPGYLVSALRSQIAREARASLFRVADAPTQVTAEWIPLQRHFQVEESYVGERNGNATLHSDQPILLVGNGFEDGLRAKGFDVSSNTMEQDGVTTSRILNASDRVGRAVMVALSRSAFGTRIELSFSESENEIASRR